MEKKILSHNKRQDCTQPLTTSEPPTQTSVAASSSREEVARSACTLHLDQGIVSVVSIKLITERAGTATPVLREQHALRYDTYAHWGLND